MSIIRKCWRRLKECSIGIFFAMLGFLPGLTWFCTILTLLGCFGIVKGRYSYEIHSAEEMIEFLCDMAEMFNSSIIFPIILIYYVVLFLFGLFACWSHFYTDKRLLDRFAFVFFPLFFIIPIALLLHALADKLTPMLPGYIDLPFGAEFYGKGECYGCLDSNFNIITSSKGMPLSILPNALVNFCMWIFFSVYNAFFLLLLFMWEGIDEFKLKKTEENIK